MHNAGSSGCRALQHESVSLRFLKKVVRVLFVIEKDVAFICRYMWHMAYANSTPRSGILNSVVNPF